MTTTEIKARLTNETRIHEIACQIRELLDQASKIELSDNRAGDEVALALATEE